MPEKEPQKEISYFKTPEAKEREYKETLLKVAKDFLTEVDLGSSSIGLSGTEFLGQLQGFFRENLRQFYEDSKEAEEIGGIKNSPLSDEVALHIIAKYAAGEVGAKDAPQVSRMFPKQNQTYAQATGKNPGYECTLASSQLHVALEKLGYTNIRTVVMAGHTALLRQLEDGSIKLYDPATTHTENGEAQGFVHVFGKDHVLNLQNIDEGGGKAGMSFILSSNEPIEDTEIFLHHPQLGTYANSFYAYSTEVLIGLSVALSNLEDFKSREDGEAKKLCERYPYLRDLDLEQIKQRSGLFDGYDHLAKG